MSTPCAIACTRKGISMKGFKLLLLLLIISTLGTTSCAFGPVPTSQPSDHSINNDGDDNEEDDEEEKESPALGTGR